jgi:hypothetical protein
MHVCSDVPETCERWSRYGGDAEPCMCKTSYQLGKNMGYEPSIA